MRVDSEAQRPKGGVGVFVEGGASPSPPVGRVRERCDLPSGVQGGAPADNVLSCMLIPLVSPDN